MVIGTLQGRTRRDSGIPAEARLVLPALLVLLAIALLGAFTSAGAAPAAPDKAATPVPDSASAAAAGDSASARAQAADSTASAARDSAARDSAGEGSVLQGKLYDYIAHPILQAITLPVEIVLVPAVKTLLYPVKPPLRYMLRNNVIDRTLQLISFGDKEQVMLYPTLNLAPGTGSYTGLTLRHSALFGRPTEKMVAMGQIYVNGDWKFRGYVNAAEILESGFESKLSLQLNRVKNASINQPGTSAFWYFADTSNVLYASLAHTLIGELGGKLIIAFRDNHYGQAPPQEDSLVSDFFPADSSGFRDPRIRGLEKDWQDRVFAISLFRDTRNNENITLTGSDLALTASYHNTDAGHDYYGWEGTWTGYYKLGRERYEISSEEEKKAGSMNIKKVLRQVEMKKLRTQIFNRKVVALHAYAAQSFEIEGNRMPTYGLNTLGNDTPLRGYGGARFKDYTVLSMGGEYRFPLTRLMDAIIFDEYGVRGRSWESIDYLEGLKNSWGFGINVRRPDIFLFRVHAGFHGLHGIQITMSVDSNY